MQENIKKLRDLAIREHYIYGDDCNDCLSCNSVHKLFINQKCSCDADEHNRNVELLFNEILKERDK